MKHEADIIDRVFDFGMQRARLEFIRDKLQNEVQALHSAKKEAVQEKQNDLDTIRFLETKNMEALAERGKLKTEVVNALRQCRTLEAANAEMVSIISNKEVAALTALRVIASGDTKNMGMRQYASKALQKIDKEKKND
jgi:hypothetical protein